VSASLTKDAFHNIEFGATSLQNFVDAYHGTGNYQKDGPRRHLRLLANKTAGRRLGPDAIRRQIDKQ
jgi:hypothetical protein